MKLRTVPLWGFKGGVLSYLLLVSVPVTAQITPDKTLPINSSIKNQGNTNRIEGGTIKGSNLFHSFEQFSVPTGSEAYFNNDINIQNIITRITGKPISNIDGILKTNGTANLLLINPNGIIFGNNAKLNIGGSFLATTASQINFADATKFSAKNPEPNPLLTISVPIGLEIESNAGAIFIQSSGHNLIGPPFSPLIRSSNVASLQVQPERTLAIVGGDVILEGGVITSEGGRIELGSVSNGSVSINPTTSGWKLGYEDVPYFQDIHLSKRALVDTSGIGSGSIQIDGRRVTLTDGSVILNQNQGTLPAGTLNVNASESLEVSGSDPVARTAGGLRSETLGFGKAGDIAISSKQVIIQNGGQINNLTFGAATSGNINVNASDFIELVGVSPFDPAVFSSISTATFNSGDADNIAVSTRQFVARDGGNLSSSTFGTGRGGDVTVSTTDSVEIIGASPITFQPSLLSSISLNAGKAGSLTISTSKLIVRDGGRVDASTLASGEGGSVTINAFKSVEVSGKISGSGEPSSVISSANIVSPTLQKLYRLPPAPSGKSGNVTINTGQLSLTEGASVNVRNDGFNDAGTLKINAASVSLNNKSAITATTSSGEGGNIFVNTRYLQLSHNSAITATAGSRGNGGNININADILTAWEKSNITANAFEGRGGNIEINTPGLFISNDSKVLANSEKGVDGRVQFIGVVELRSTDPKPETVRETSKITSACEARPGVPTGRFVITGTGSPPPILKEKTSDNVAWQDNSNLVQKADNLDEIQLPTEDIKPIVEANTWILNPNGQVQLIAKYNTGSSDLRLYANACFTEHFSNQSSSMSEIVNNKND
ncbi:two-partner secretion domain-containing protein [Nostoc sp. 'Peltigera membranacea cyanobiont' N6]|uniref:two-partner secretion domain-containing protein n=1 Tax=Nostoc sp. 'Peltigera membranacea cyanobiont' N6 TaxID=1261031 RepID=UPI0015E2CC28|nr:filamentous hemagglutinin N-terminal domain-containing protein [Nostoc sp. 'Peltigera membranacea cyanobiont' N6]